MWKIIPAPEFFPNFHISLFSCIAWFTALFQLLNKTYLCNSSFSAPGSQNCSEGARESDCWSESPSSQSSWRGTVLYCTVLYCTVLYCTVLYCTVLYCTVLYCTGLDWIMLCPRYKICPLLPLLPIMPPCLLDSNLPAGRDPEGSSWARPCVGFERDQTETSGRVCTGLDTGQPRGFVRVPEN